jgi:hypothetical protein
MAVLNMVDQLTAIEAVKRGENPEPYHIIEALSQTNEMLADLPVLEANNGTVHTTLIRNMELNFQGNHRVYNQGVGFKATVTDTIQDRTMMIEAYSVVDKTMADHSGDKAQLRHSEAVAFLNGMGIEQQRCLLYGNFVGDKAEINGFATRLNKLSPATDRNRNVFGMGGATAGSQTSVYLVAAGPNFCHMIYPRGAASIGVKRDDLGEQIWTQTRGAGGDVTDNKYQALVEHFSLQFGLVIRHPGAVKRICNIDTTTLDTAAGEALVNKVLEIRRLMPAGSANYILYANPTILSLLDYTARERGNVIQTREDPWGKEITHVRDIRCRQVDQLLDTEDIVAA